ncbi:MAG: superoxide dismutase [Desulfosarcina sp.]|jgi:Fe-Mn family superoxide dismutase
MATSYFPITSRLFFRCSLLVACILAALFLMHCSSGGDSAIFVKEPLPYAKDSLAPFISADTMGFHYDKHYAGYVKKANQLTNQRKYAGKTPEAVIRMTAGDPEKAAVFNNAAQAWNHAYFFKCLKPNGGGEPEGALAEMIESAFGSFVNFKRLFLTAAKDQFGSGWVWLVLEEGELAVVAGTNADTPLAHGLTPLFTVDVWEHAYYLDYQNRRVEFVTAVLDNLANWDFVAAQLEKTLPAKDS